MNFRMTMILYFYLLLHGVSTPPCSTTPCTKDALDDKVNHENTHCYNHEFPFCAGEIGNKFCCRIGNGTIGAVCDTDDRCYDPAIADHLEYCSSEKRMCVVDIGGPCRNKYNCENLINCTNGVCKIPFNDPCNVNKSCPTILKCEARTGREPVTATTCLSPENGRCEKSQNCVSNLVCLEASHVCLPPIRRGFECLVPGDCETDLVCQYNEAEKNKKTCNANTGKECDTHKECVLNSTCRNRVCVARLTVGSSGCVNDEDCLSGLICEGGGTAAKTCVTGLGGACTNDKDCSRDLICSGSKCVSGLGGVCYQKTDCLTDLICENLREGDTSKKTCVSGLGKECYRNAHCSANRTLYREELICEGTLDNNRKCVSVLNGSCQTTETCSSGLECQGGSPKICVARLGGKCSENELKLCLTELICQGDTLKTCVAGLGGFCENTAHCENGLTCEGNKSDTCVSVLGGFCNTDADCLNILTCEGDNLKTCVSGHGGECFTDADCFGNLTCEGNATLNETQTCVAALGEACSADAHCSEDLVCEGDRCVSALGGVCFTDADCSGGLICDGNKVCAEEEEVVIPSQTFKIIVPTILILIGLAVLS